MTDEMSPQRPTADEPLFAENEALSRLYSSGALCASPTVSFQACLDYILETAIAISGTDKGTLQLYDEASGALQLVVASGFSQQFVEFFSTVQLGHAAICGVAAMMGERVIVEDLSTSTLFEQPSREVLLEAGVRACQSTPLESATGKLVGMFSTHFSYPHRPSGRTCRLLDLLARQAADYLERKRSERALQQATKQLQVVTDAMAAPITHCSRDMKYLWVSKSYADWIGRPAREIVGRTIVDVIGAEAFEQLRPYFERVLAGEVVRYEEQISYERIGPRWVAATCTPTHDARGLCDGWVALVLDITAQKDAELALRETDRRKNEFLAMLAHELRNPLAPIRNAVEVLATIGPPDGPHGRAREMIARQVTHMARLVDDLLDVSRITRGTITLKRAILSLAELIEEAADTIRPQIIQHEQRLSLELDPQPMLVDVDRARVVQVIVNLLTNAVKFTPRQGHITVSSSTSKGEALIRVRDSGIGIPPERLADVFELFWQGDTSLARSQGGLGVGLTLVKYLVELHGGRVWVHSEGHDRGSEFTVALPLALAQERSQPVAVRESVVAPGVRVLVVEDNADAAETFKMLLELGGHTVRVAEHGRAALAILDDFEPSVAFVDLGLPEMSGFELAGHLRAHPRTKHAVLVALTGYGREEDKQQALRAGFDQHMLKPVAAKDVWALLASVRPG
jgi:PAS domain S-box-containing protein